MAFIERRGGNVRRPHADDQRTADCAHEQADDRHADDQFDQREGIVALQPGEARFHPSIVVA
jgi:hypothetical protein